MTSTPPSVSSARPLQRVLLTNDDGIDAPGLRVLEQVAATLAHEVWVVAPEHDRSGASHAISLSVPLRVTPCGERRFAVSGTPGDCVVLATRRLMGGSYPDLVLSGINRGANLGVETVFSGTVGAAMTALLLGLPAIALSQALRSGDPVRWDTAASLSPAVLRQLIDATDGAPMCLNVNFPDVPADAAGPLAVTTQGLGTVHGIEVDTRVDPRGFNYHWLNFQRVPRVDDPGAESAVVAAGGIAVTPLRFERTDDAMYQHLLRHLAAGA